MKKELNGSDIADFVKERQLKAVRGLRQQEGVTPTLAIIRTNPDPIVDSYMKIKQTYGADIEAEVVVHTIDQTEALGQIEKLNNDGSVHGIIVQIPLPKKDQTDNILNSVSIEKDVDGLAKGSKYDAPTPVAITWLLAGYDVDLRHKNIVIVGRGRLVGAPLARLWEPSKLDIHIADLKTKDIGQLTQDADVIISAAGVPGLITADMIKPDAIIVDAGVSTDSNGLVGDIASDVRELDTVTITPQKGGVGPLTVSALFENLITATRKTTHP